MFKHKCSVVKDGREGRSGGLCYLSIGVLVMLVVAGVVVLLDETKVLLPLSLQRAGSALGIGRQVTLRKATHTHKQPIMEGQLKRLF